MSKKKPINDLPYTKVVRIGIKETSVRHIRLPPKEAVVWCMADELGMQGMDTDAAATLLVQLPNGWKCGLYTAVDPSVLKKEEE